MRRFLLALLAPLLAVPAPVFASHPTTAGAFVPVLLVAENVQPGANVDVRIRNDGSASFHVFDPSHCGPAYEIRSMHDDALQTVQPVPCILSIPPPVEVLPGQTTSLGSWDQKIWSCSADACSSTLAPEGAYAVSVRFASGDTHMEFSQELQSRFWIGRDDRRFTTVRMVSVPASVKAGERAMGTITVTPPAGTRYEGAIVSMRRQSIQCFSAPCYDPQLITVVPYALPYGNAVGGDETFTVDLGAIAEGSATVYVHGRTSATTAIIAADGVATFPDVPSSHWARAYIELLVIRGVLRGHADGRFHPQWNITRAEVAKVALLSAGINPQTGLPNPYADLPAAHTLRDELLTAIARGHLEDDAPYVWPNKPATRFETLKALMDAFGRAPVTTLEPVVPAFPDAPSGETAAYSSIAQKEGIISGNSGKFLPYDPITRAEVAKIVYGLLTR